MDFKKIFEEYKTLILAVGVLFLAIAISILILNLYSNRKKPVLQIDEPLSYKTESIIKPGTDQPIDLLNFEFPDYKSRLESPGIYYYRPQLKIWQQEQVDIFLIPTDIIINDLLEETDKKIINDFLTNID